MKTVLFICTGNTCRSPMAQGLFNDLVKGRHDIEVISAGVGAMHGQPPSPFGVEVMEEIGIDISGIRSQPVVADLVRRADYIFVMTYGHLDSMLLLFPMAGEKTFLLREFETDLPVMEREVPDPVGHPREAYVACRDQIRHALPRLLDMVLHSTITPVEAPNLRKVAIASDNQSLELKKIIHDWLVQNNYHVENCNSSEPGSVLDEALQVAYSVVNRTTEFGILIEAAGQGMSMVANKVEGVRAALVHDVETARLSREKNNANILCLSSSEAKPKRVKEILEVWFNTVFTDKKTDPEIKMESEAKTNKKSTALSPTSGGLVETDGAVFRAIANERARQRDNIELIPSENYCSRAVVEAQGSCMTDKYAEGYPGKRYYGGCENVDVVEQLAIDRAKEVFGAEHANVQPHSGSGANMAVYLAALQPGDTVLAMELTQGGHLTHGHPKNFSGRFFKIVPYGVSPESEQIDYDQLAKLALENKPKMIIAGATAYSRIFDFKKMREIADSVGAFLFVDMAHIAGLVAAGVHPSPIPYADFVTTTTHKTLRGPRGGIIFCKEKYAKEIDSQVFPGIQGGPLMHVIAAKAVCLGEALKPEFKTYQQQIVRNAKALCEGMKKNGYRIVSGGTENHLMLVDIQSQQITGKEAQELLDQVSITVNKNTIPFDKQSAFKGSGIRIGTPAITSRGMKEDEMFDIAGFIHDALSHRQDAEYLKKLKQRVQEFSSKFPMPY